jgi:hypothetical protein
MQTVETPYGVLPVVDTWRQCRHTRAGWTAINEKGQRLNLTYRPEERDFGPARMPDWDYVVLTRPAAANEYGDVHGHVPMGVALLERTSRTAKAKAMMRHVAGDRMRPCFP